MSLFDWYFYKEEEPLLPPERPKYLYSKGHYRLTTDFNRRHKRSLVQKRRRKNKAAKKARRATR